MPKASPGHDYTLHETMNMPNKDFPIRVFPCECQPAVQMFHAHWHEQLELLCFIEGSAVVECNSNPVPVKAGELLVINSNELHAGYTLTEGALYYCIIIDISLLESSFTDSCEIKYIAPITRNLILFNNRIGADREIESCIQQIVTEFKKQEIAYELAIKSAIYHILTVLIRQKISRVLSTKEYERRSRSLERLRDVFRFISHNYTKKLDIETLAGMAHMSPYYFCHLFKEVTGKTLSQFLNHKRINRAEFLLKTTTMTVAEIARESGFEEINYFSRIYKQYKKVSPSAMRKRHGALEYQGPIRHEE